MTRPRTLRVAVHGLGVMGQRHARVLQSLPGVEVVPVDPARGFAAPAGRIDAAIVATPATTHRAVAEPLLAAGLPCLVEKPLAATEEDAAVLAGYRHLCVGHVERWNPAVRALGDVAPAWVRTWTRLSLVRRVTGGPRGRDVPVALDLAVHDLDLIAVWSGGEAPARVEADGDDDRLEARLWFASGRTATIVSDRAAQTRVRTAEMTAPGGLARLDLANGGLVLFDTAGEALRRGQPPPPPHAHGALGELLDAFVAAVRGDAPFVPCGADGARAVAWAAWLHDAARGPR